MVRQASERVVEHPITWNEAVHIVKEGTVELLAKLDRTQQQTAVYDKFMAKVGAVFFLTVGVKCHRNNQE
jgi:hypothetical protein